MKKTAIKTVKDIQSGAIIKTEKNHEYVLLRDDAGVPSMYSKDGKFVRLNPDGLCDVKGGHKIAKISAFLTMPQADQISEALKYLYTGREACAELSVVYEKENEEVKAAKEDLVNINHHLAEVSQVIANLFNILQENGVDIDETLSEMDCDAIEDFVNDDCDCDDEDWDD